MHTERPIISISIAAHLVKLHPRTLMLYEKTGLVSPHRTKTARRLYSKKDLATLQFIKFLTQEKGVNLSGALTLFKAIEAAQPRNVDLKKILFPDFNPRPLI